MVRMHGKVIATANEAIKNINNKELPDVRESVEENHEMVKKNEEKLGNHENSIKRNEKELEQDASLISDNKVLFFLKSHHNQFTVLPIEVPILGLEI